LHALGAGEDRIVIGEDRAARGVRAEQRRVDGARAGDEAVGRAEPPQVIHRAPAALGGERQAANLEEAAVVAQVRDVLARRAHALGVTPRDRIGAGGVEQALMRGEGAGEIVAHEIEIDRAGVARRVAPRAVGTDEDDRASLGKRLADRRRDSRDRAAELRQQGDFHLHRLGDGDELAGLDRIAFRDMKLDQAAIIGRDDGERA